MADEDDLQSACSEIDDLRDRLADAEDEIFQLKKSNDNLRNLLYDIADLADKQKDIS